MLIGVLGMTYIKWGMYVYYDYQQIADATKEYVQGDQFEGDLKSEKAFTYFEMDIDFDEQYSFDENWEYCQGNAYDTINAICLYSQVSIGDYYTEEQQEEMKDCTLYEWYDYDTLLGKTKEECKANLEKAKSMTAYEFMKERGLEDYFSGSEYISEPSLGEVLAHPGKLWSDIKDIAEEGRWSYTSSSSSTLNEDKEAVKGWMLWVVWICELAVIVALTVMFAYPPSKEIFIEMDNDWAVTDEKSSFAFSMVSDAQLKSMLEQSPDNVVRLSPVEPLGLAGRPYIKLTVSHSRDYSENYINAFRMTYNAKSKNYGETKVFKGLKATPRQIGVLYDMFGLAAPGRIASDAEYLGYKQQTEQGYNAGEVQSAARADSGFTCKSCGASMSADKKFCPHCGAPNEAAKKDGDGFDRASFEAWRNAARNKSEQSEMDSISTDDIDVSKLDE